MRNLVYVLFALFAVIVLGCGGEGTYAPTVAAGGGGQVVPNFNIVLRNGQRNAKTGRAITDTNSQTNPLTAPYPAQLLVEIDPVNTFNETATVTATNVTGGYTVTPQTTVQVNGSTATATLTVDLNAASASRGALLGTATITVTIGGVTKTATAYFTTLQPDFTVTLFNGHNAQTTGTSRQVIGNSLGTPLTPPTPAQILVQVTPINGFTGTVNVLVSNTTNGFAAGVVSPSTLTLAGTTASNTQFPVSFNNQQGALQNGTSTVTVTGGGVTHTVTAFYQQGSQQTGKR